MNYRFDKQVASIMQNAQNEAKDMGNNYVGSEHLLLAIIKDSSTNFSRLLAAQGIFYYQLKEDLMVLFGLKDKNVEDILMTQVVEDIIERGMLTASKNKQKQMDADSLSVALLQSENCVAIEILNRYDLNISSVMRELDKGSDSELDKFSELRNLNSCMNNKDIIGRDKELDFMIAVLSRKEKANPLLIGDPGVGKTALVEKLASMIVLKKVPASLQDAIIYELHLNTLVAGTKYRGDFEEKLQNLIKALQKYPNVILFVDEIHQMIGAGKSEGSIDVSSVLKPYLARGAIKCIGATTTDEYEKYIEKDRALERRFQVISIKEPTKMITAKMMESKLSEYATFHNVEIGNELIEGIVNYCDYFMPNRRFPDKAIDVLDLACVMTQRLGKKQVEESVVKAVIEQLTDIPIASKDRLVYLNSILNEHIFGQSAVIEKMMKQISWIEQGVIANRPLGVWLFLGNQGVGKSTLIKTFNRAYFNQEEEIEWDVTSSQSMNRSLQKIKRNPYSIMSIINIHEATPSMMQMLKHAIEKGYVEVENTKIDLRHCIMIFQGNFAYQSASSLRFNERKGWITQVAKMLGEDMLDVFDEVFIFEDLNKEHKHAVVKAMLSLWHKEVDEDSIQEAIESSSTLEEAAKILKRKIVLG